MEMPTVGQRCAHDECKQLDFLPFTCAHCARVFCKNHYSAVRHSCAAAPDRVADVDEAAPTEHHCCSFLGCAAHGPLEMPCPACRKHFCLEHRHHGCIDVPYAARESEREKWNAPRKLFEAAKAEADRQVSQNLNRAVGKAGVRKTARKLQLMRLKGKAVGPKNVPTDDRVYFLVHLPLSTRLPSRAIYVSRHWSVGRAIDATSDLCSVANRNNEATGRRLRLFRISDGAMVAAEMDRKLEDLLGDETIHDGESLVLEYLDEGTERLNNVASYRG